MPNYEKEDVELFLTIKKEIDALVDKEIILLSKTSQKIDKKAIEEKNTQAFFAQMQVQLETFLSKCIPFFDLLQKDDPLLYDKLKNAPKLEMPKDPNYDTLKYIRKTYSNDLLSKDDLKKIQATGEKWFSEGQFDKAHLYFLFLSLSIPKDPNIWLIKGLIEQNIKDYQEALNSYCIAPDFCHLVRFENLG